MERLASAKILLIVGGGIAAYKALELIRRLKDAGAGVEVVMTEAAKHFITPLSAASLSGNPVRDALFSLDDEARMGHIELSRSSDLIVVAPATADLIARMANGLANDLATTTLLATDKRVLLAPAMNVRMWLAAPTRRNVASLAGDGALFVGPDEGAMACGEFGPGRMAEPAAILDAIEKALRPPRPNLEGRHVVVTSGPTVEPIDPVRFLSNRSSGRQGHAIAAAALDAGATVTLISGPVALEDPKGARTIHVETAAQMMAAAEAALPADIFIAAAAVSDWRSAAPRAAKIKKAPGVGVPELALVENPDILRAIASRTADRPKIVIGFAAETENTLENAKKKLRAKGCDFVVANNVADGSGVFGGADNEVALVSVADVQHWPRMSKQEVARKLIAVCAGLSDSSP